MEFEYVINVLESIKKFDLQMLMVSYYVLLLRKYSSDDHFQQYNRLLNAISIKSLINHTPQIFPEMEAKILALLAQIAPEYFKSSNYLIEQELKDRTTFVNKEFLNPGPFEENMDFSQLAGRLEYSLRLQVENEKNQGLVLLPWFLEKRFCYFI
jgi:hypothetical protein